MSAKTMARPSLILAVAQLDSGDGSVLMVAKLDRLTRSVDDATGLWRLPSGVAGVSSPSMPQSIRQPPKALRWCRYSRCLPD